MAAIEFGDIKHAGSFAVAYTRRRKRCTTLRPQPLLLLVCRLRLLLHCTPRGPDRGHLARNVPGLAHSLAKQIRQVSAVSRDWWRSCCHNLWILRSVLRDLNEISDHSWCR